MSDIPHEDERVSGISMLNDTRESLAKPKRRGNSGPRGVYSPPTSNQLRYGNKKNVDIDKFLSSPHTGNRLVRLPSGEVELSPRRGQGAPYAPADWPNSYGRAQAQPYDRKPYPYSKHAPTQSHAVLPTWGAMQEPYAPKRYPGAPKMYSRNDSLKRTVSNSGLARQFVDKRPVEENPMEVDGSSVNNYPMPSSPVYYQKPSYKQPATQNQYPRKMPQRESQR